MVEGFPYFKINFISVSWGFKKSSRETLIQASFLLETFDKYAAYSFLRPLPNLIDFAVQKQPPELFCKKVVLKNFENFTGKYLWNTCESLFNKFASLH